MMRVSAVVVACLSLLAACGDSSTTDESAVDQTSTTSVGVPRVAAELSTALTAPPVSDSELDGADRFDPADPPPGLIKDLDLVWQYCGAGSADACDYLFAAAPGGTAYHAFGLSCGGRRIGDCATVIAESADAAPAD